MSHGHYHALEAILGESKDRIDTGCYVADPRFGESNYEGRKIRVLAIWDTGATHTVISTTLVHRLGVTCSPQRQEIGIFDPTPAAEYRAHPQARSVNAKGKTAVTWGELQRGNR